MKAKYIYATSFAALAVFLILRLKGSREADDVIHEEQDQETVEVDTLASSDNCISMTGFSWVIPEKLAGMPRPGISAPIQEDLCFLKRQKISMIVSLTEDSLPAESFGFSSLHLPVVDMSAPTVEQLKGFVSVVSEQLAAGERVSVHCTAGKGRTGTFLAAYFIHQGMTPAQAIDKIRSLRPGSIETEDQVAVLYSFASSQ